MRESPCLHMARKGLSLSALFLLFACSKNPAPALDCGILPSLPESVEAATTLRAKGSRWTNAQIRARYVCEAQRIGRDNEQWKASGLSALDRAHKAYDLRHNARLVARAMMPDPAEVKALQDRDMTRYGTPDGPSFEWLMKREAERGVAGDEAYENIVKSAQRTDEATSRAVLPP